MKHPIEKGKCYVVHQGFGDIYEMFGGRTDLINYPENKSTSFQRRCGILYEKSIITESAQFISCYDRNNVFMWKNGEWVNPEEQTFLTSFEILETNLLGFTHSIPIRGIEGESAVDTLRKRIEEQYKI